MRSYDHGHQLLENFIRGDAMVGLIADVPATTTEMVEALWAAASADDPRAYLDLGECYLAHLQPLGAFDGIDPADAAGRPWSAAAAAFVEPDLPALEAALRCQREAARLGDRDAVATLVRLTRHASADSQRHGLALVRGLDAPTGAELYLTGLVELWLGDAESSARTHTAAAAAGDADAQFELSLYYGQGIGVAADPDQSSAWLRRAADAGHTRALYNLGARLASGADGAVDLAQAATYYRRAADAGHGRAAATLAVMILTGELAGQAQDAAALLDQADAAGFASTDILDAVGLDDPRADAAVLATQLNV